MIRGPWIAIVNRSAGMRPVSSSVVDSALANAEVEATVVTPRTAEEARDAVERAVKEGMTNYISVGGDGTASLIVNALMNAGAVDPVLAILPAGTGCDLIRTFGIPQNIEGAARHLATDNTYPIDVGVLEGEWGTRFFINVAQTGVGAAAAETASSLPRWFGPLRYPLSFAVRLTRFPRALVAVTTQRRTLEQPALAVILANAQFFAGGWNVAPKATMVDGVLDVQIIESSKPRVSALAAKIIKGNHLSDRAVRPSRAAEFTVESDVPWPVEADGDYLGSTPFSGRVIPAAIRLKI